MKPNVIFHGAGLSGRTSEQHIQERASGTKRGQKGKENVKNPSYSNAHLGLAQPCLHQKQLTTVRSASGVGQAKQAGQGWEVGVGELGLCEDFLSPFEYLHHRHLGGQGSVLSSQINDLRPQPIII